MTSLPFDSPRWYATPRFRAIAVGILIAFALGEGFVGIFRRDNDFLLHRVLGEAFISGDPYAKGGLPYLPARTMLNAATAWLPYRVDRALVYVVALAALAWTMLAWKRLANEAHRFSGTAFAAMFFTLAISVAYIQRDLDDCGLHLLLLFFLTAAAVSLDASQPARCGFWLALATVYKATPLLFLPYLCLKRQWRAAAWMAAFTVALCLAPALWLGWDVNQTAHERWWAQMKFSSNLSDPAENGITPPNHRNQALVLALARFVQTYPPGHDLYLDNPLFAQFGNLEPATAKRVVQVVILLLAGALAWRFRKSHSAPENRIQEWAAVILLTSILSPICWLQHQVLVIPAVYLVIRAALEPGGLTGWRRVLGIVAAIIMVLGAQRDLLGHGLFMVAMSYKVHTWAALIALLLVLQLRASKFHSAAAPDQPITMVESSQLARAS